MTKVLCTRAVRCDSGATSIEYGLIAALVSVAIYAGAGKVSDAVGDHFRKISERTSNSGDGNGVSGRSTGLVPASPGRGSTAGMWEDRTVP